MNQIKNLAGQTLVYGLGTIVPRILNYLLLTPFYTRLLLQPEYGKLTKLYAYGAFFIVLLTFGTETSFFRYAKKYSAKTVFSNAFLFILLTSVIAITTLFFHIDSITNFLNVDGAKTIILIVSGIVLTDIFTSLPFARLRYENKAKHFSILKLINVILNIGFNVFFFFLLPELQHIEFFQSIYSVEFSYGYAFLSNLLANIVTLFMLIPQFKFSFKSLELKIIGIMFIYSYPIVLSGLAGMINDVGDKVFLDFFILDNFESNYAIGIYGANYKIATLMIIFIQMFKYAAEPFFFRISEQVDHKNVYADVTKAFVYTGLFIFISIIGYIDIFKYFIDTDYRVGLDIVPFVLLGNFFFGLFYNISIWYKITDRTKFGVYFTFIGASITILLNALLIPIMGYMGSAIATLVCFFVMALTNGVVGRKKYYIPYEWTKLFKLFSITILLVFFFWIFRSNNIIYSVIFGTLIIFAYLGSLLLVDPLVLNYIKNKISRKLW